jgi:heat shock protein HslJ
MPHPRRIALSLVLATLGLGFAAGCQSGGASSGGGSSMKDPIQKLAGEWVLSKLQGQDAAAMLPAGARLPSLDFAADGKVSGFGGVNRLASSLDPARLAQGKFSIGNMISTKMAGPPEAMNMENRFTSLLGQADGFRFTDGGKGLSLTQGGSSILDFVRAR